MIISVGKAVLYQMLGIQESYYTPVKVPESCKNCPWIEAAMKNPSSAVVKKLNQQCSCCSNHHEDILQYINEKNKYGTKEKVCRNAIQLFMLLHTFHPSQSGYIGNISIHSISITLNVSERTIKNCLNILSKKNYIFVDYMGHGFFNTILLDYPKYFLTADKGGRGFVKIPEDTLDKLCKIKNILAFRVILRQFLEGNEQDTSKSYNQLRKTLPNYCKRNVIIKALTDYKNTIYNIKTSLNDVLFSLQESSNTKSLIQAEKENAIAHFQKILAELDDFIWSGQPVSSVPEHLKRFVYNPLNQNSVPELVFFQKNNTEGLIYDLAQLSLTYSIETVTNALADTYRDKMCQKHSLIRNIGAYVQTVIKSYQSTSTIA